MYDGRLVPRTVLREVKKNLMQGGIEGVQYEVDDQKVLELMIEFGGLDN